MNNATFGLTMLIVGMGGTLVTLALVSFLIHLLTIFFPLRRGEKEEQK